MATFRLDEVARAANGRVAAGDPARTVSSYSIDSRTAAAGDLFFALPGRRDGHDFVAAAAAGGAAAAVVSRDVGVPAEGFGLVRVADTAAALRDLGREALRRAPVRVVGITGSVGKTTTKEFAAAVLATKLRVLKSEGNLNNHLGVPLTLLRLRPDHQAAVVEMGMSAPGEIAALTRIAPPDVAVLTNVRPVHLEFFPGIEGIAMAKKEILDGAAPGATAVLNGDDPLVAKAAAGWRGRIVRFGLGPANDVRAEDVRDLGERGRALVLVYGGDRFETELPFVNPGLVMDALAAAAVGLALGLSAGAVRTALSTLRAQAGRGGIVEAPGGLRVCDDTYNSNPAALEAALRGLGALPAARRAAVLGDMLELGPAGPDYHRRAGRVVAESGWDLLVAVGPLSEETARGAREAGMPAGRVVLFPDSAAAAAAIRGLVRAGDLVLVKGSRGMRMENVVRALVRPAEE